ncbi:MAG: hypothetical protein LLG09_05930 [Negativicutes bacterium]|nr:hypothetical protein [Negativicutes bacterium]
MTSEVKIISCDPFYLTPVFTALPQLQTEDYLSRLSLLQERMQSAGLTHLLVYADREHFANMDYLIGHDPRFEEALLILDTDGARTLLVGNEGWGHSSRLPVQTRRILHQTFSLQGQPRQKTKPLARHLRRAGIGKNSRLGLIGYKYFLTHEVKDAEHQTDLPAYLLEEIYRLTPRAQVWNFTASLTGLPDGLRLRLCSAKEVAIYEQIAERTAQSVIRMLKFLKPGISELELSSLAAMDALPISAFPMINFGAQHVANGLRSPNEQTLQLGDPVCICRALRGALVSRAGIAAYDEASLPTNLKKVTEQFYRPFWAAMAAWYETVGIGVSGGELYESIFCRIGSRRFGVSLNPGHHIGADEWINSEAAAGSTLTLAEGAYLQSDVIASHAKPVYSAIMEDGLVLAGTDLRRALAAEYPLTWQRIQERRTFMRTRLGIGIKPEVLPLSSLCGIYFPYFLNCNRIFSKAE